MLEPDDIGVQYCIVATLFGGVANWIFKFTGFRPEA